MTADNKTAFITWSGNKSLPFALFLYQWIPRHLAGARCWGSFRESDLPQGLPDYLEITTAAKQAGACVAIITQDNKLRPWFNFEAGMFVAQSKHVYTVLCELEIDHLRGEGHPLGFQNATSPTLVSVRNLLRGLNEQLQLGIADEVLVHCAVIAFQEFREKYLSVFPEMTEEVRETQRFNDRLADY
jgi:hypothetical protein